MLGHGQLGLLDRLRDFDELLQDSGGDRRPYLELQLGVVVSQWSVVSGSIYKASVVSSEFMKMGVLRDVVGVETMVEPRALARVETATTLAGEFYADVDTWTETGTTEANGAPTIYLRLPDSSDPANTTVVALLLFTFGVKGETHPWLGPNKLLNGGFESWASATDLNDWTEGAAANTSIDREATIKRTGDFSVKVSHAGSASDATAGITQAAATSGVAGKRYRLAGYYFTTATNPVALVPVVRVLAFGTSLFLKTDGRTWTAAVSGFTDEPTLQSTLGEWRRFVLDFQAMGSFYVWPILKNRTGGVATGSCYFDAFTVQRIYRWNLYEPRIAAGSIPDLQIASQSILFKGKTLGIGGVTLINGDGELAKAMAGLLTMNKPAQVWMGGVFGNGEEVYRDNWLGFFPGRTQQPTVTDAEVRWDLEDSRALTKINAPADKYSLADFPTMYLNQEGYARPYLFGRTRETLIKPTRIAFGPSGEYGKYESYDNTIQAGRSAGLPKMFPNEELAYKNLLGQDITDDINDFTFSGSTFTVLRDIRNYRYDRAGNDVGTDSSFDFDTGGGALVANVDIIGPAYKVAADLQAAMRTAIGGADTTTLVTYSETTHLFRVRRTSGTLRLLPKTGVNSHKKSWQILGFDTGSDKTAGNDYTGEEPTFIGPDEDHVLRWTDASGYQDDSSGTILGASAEDLDTPAAVASWLLQRVAKVAHAKVDIAEFKVAHDSQRADNMQLRAYFHSPEDLAGVLARLEQAGLMDLCVDGEGVWHCTRYTTGSTGALELFDRDYLSFEMYLDPRSIFKLVRVLYGYDPQFAKWAKKVDGIYDAGVPVKHGSDEILDVLSYFDNDGGVITAAAATLASRLQRLSGLTPRIAAFTVVGRLPGKLPGDKVVLTRTAPGVLGTTGSLAAVAFRLLSLTHTPGGVSKAVAVEDVEFQN